MNWLGFNVGYSGGIERLEAERKNMLPCLPGAIESYELREAHARQLEVAVGISRCLEDKFREAKFMPQHRYLTRPVYKACVGYIGPVAATAVSFLAADVIVHHLIWQTAGCFDAYLRSGEATCSIVWNPGYTVSWMAMAVPVMYAKYRSS